MASKLLPPLSLLLLAACGGGSGPAPTPDPIPVPTRCDARGLTVTLASPSEPVLTRGVVQVSVRVSGQVDAVHLIREGVLIAELPSPYTYAWDTMNVEEGTYAPDCTHIAFFRSEGLEINGPHQLMGLDLATHTVEVLLDDGHRPAFSPDGRQVAYLSVLDVEADDVYVHTLGTAQRRLVTQGSAYAGRRSLPPPSSRTDSTVQVTTCGGGSEGERGA